MATDKRKALEKEYRKLAKRADQRLVRLEQYAESNKKYKSILKFSYERAIRDIRSWSGENASRFNTKPPSNTNQLKAKISDIKRFLASASSTLKETKENKGIISTYNKRVKSINEKFGTNFTWETLAHYYETGMNKKLDMQLDSETKMEVVAVIRENEDAIKEAFAENKKIHIKAYDQKTGKRDKILETEVNKIISQYGFADISELFV